MREHTGPRGNGVYEKLGGGFLLAMAAGWRRLSRAPPTALSQSGVQESEGQDWKRSPIFLANDNTI